MATTGNNEVIDKKKLDRIKFSILELEDENSKTKNYTQSEMVEKIRNIIKNTVNKKY